MLLLGLVKLYEPFCPTVPPQLPVHEDVLVVAHENDPFGKSREGSDEIVLYATVADVLAVPFVPVHEME